MEVRLSILLFISALIFAIISKNFGDASSEKDKRVSLFPLTKTRSLVSRNGTKSANRRHSTWPNWNTVATIMGHYFGRGFKSSGKPHAQNQGWRGNNNAQDLALAGKVTNTNAKENQGMQMAKIIYTSGRLFEQIVDLNRVTALKALDTVLKLTNVPTTVRSPVHLRDNPPPTSKTKPEAGGFDSTKKHYGWRFIPDENPFVADLQAGGAPPVTNIREISPEGVSTAETGRRAGWGWPASNTNAPQRLTTKQLIAYKFGRSLAAMSKFSKLVQEGWNMGNEDPKTWLSYGLGYVNIDDYYKPNQSQSGWSSRSSTPSVSEKPAIKRNSKNVKQAKQLPIKLPKSKLNVSQP